MLLRVVTVLSLIFTASCSRGSQALERIAFGSCNFQEVSQDFWEPLGATDPELFLYIGDNVYGDVSRDANGKFALIEPNPETLAAAYARLAASPQFQAFRSQVPILATWDDHDFGPNDGGGDYMHKQDAREQFLDFWQVAAGDQRREREGVYYAKSFGPPGKRIQIILLDTRYFRSPWKSEAAEPPFRKSYSADRDPSKTLLGDGQWSWLEQRLSEEVELNIVVSSIQVLANIWPLERWGAFPHEQERLLSLIANSRAAQTVLLSGDRHLGGLYRTELADGRTLYELTSSSLNMPLTVSIPAYATLPEPDPLRIGERVLAANFGRLELDWQKSLLNLSLVGMQGETLLEQEISLNP